VGNRRPTTRPKAPIPPERARPSRRARVVIGLLVLSAALVAILLWLRREPSWSVVIDAQDTEVIPWESTHLGGRVTPKRAMKSPEGWHSTWTDNGAVFATETMETDWKEGAIGSHELALVVQSPWGTRKTASVTVTVAYKSFLAPMGMQAGSTLKSEPAPAGLPFGIQDVWVEKSSVCQGEPSRIRLTPFDHRGEAKWLKPTLGSSSAWESVFVAPLSPPGMRAVPVQVADYRQTGGSEGGAANTFVMIEVKDCVAPFPMYVTWKLAAQEADYIRFDVRLFDGPAWVRANEHGERGLALAHADKYRWDLGDGSARVTTAEPNLSHHFPPEGNRPDELATTYFATVEALDAAGTVMATAYTGVDLRNPTRELKHRDGLVQLLTDQTPWSTKNDDGSRTVEFTLWNIDPTETVALDSDADVSLKDCDGDKVTHRSTATSDFLEGTTLAPMQKIHGRFTVSKADVDRICWADVALKGKTQPGSLDATGFFGLDCGKKTQPLVGKEKGDLLMKAMTLLGNPSHVSTEDIHRLEDEGKIPRGVLIPGH
jgi:hypothetical protein